MFSGIVEEKGRIEKARHRANLSTIYVRGDVTAKGTKTGDSICTSGVCLTVTGIKNKVMTFDIMKETLDKTTLGILEEGAYVNLERSLRADSRICGHFVSGHVDNMEKIVDVITKPNYVELRISIGADLAKYIVPKGSVCLDGVSLTVGDVRKKDFSVYLIPFTLKVTTLGLNKPGDRINIETDILAKYVLAGTAESANPYVYRKE
jgi:riboflavin synthase